MKTRAYSTSVTTSWAPLPSKGGRTQSVTVLNRTGAALSVCYTADTGDGDAGATLLDGEAVNFNVYNDPSEISIQASAGATGVEFLIDQA